MKYRYAALTLGLIILLVCITGCTSSSSSSQSSSGSSQQPDRIIAISEKTTAWETEFDEPVLVVRGLVTNQLGRADSYVLVTCTVYDTNMVKLGYNNDGLGNLANGASARFEVRIPNSMIKGGFPKNFKWDCEAS